MKLAVFAILASSTAAFTPPSMTFAVGKKASSPAKTVAVVKKAVAAPAKKIIAKAAPVAKKVEAKVSPFAKKVEAKVSPFAKKVEAKVSPFAKKVEAKVSPFAKKVEAKATSTARKVEAKVSPFAKKVAAKVSPFAKKVEAKVSPFAKKVEAKATSTAKKVEAKVSPFAKKAQAKVSPFAKKVQAKATSTAKKVGANVSPFAKKVEARASSAAKKVGANVSPFAKKMEARASSAAKQVAAKAKPAFKKAVAKVASKPKPSTNPFPKKIVLKKSFGRSGGVIPSAAIPYEFAPALLDGSLPGDAGFDPCFLSTKADDMVPYFTKLFGGNAPQDGLTWYREAELMHGRIAQVAVVGFIAPGFGTLPGEGFGYTNPLEALGSAPSASIAQIFLFMAAMEFRRITIILEDGPRYMAGDSQKWGQGDGRWNPLNFNYTPAEYAEKQLQETKHGRLAMIGLLGLIFQANASGLGVVDQLSAALVYPDYVGKAGYYFPESI